MSTPLISTTVRPVGYVGYSAVGSTGGSATVGSSSEQDSAQRASSPYVSSEQASTASQSGRDRGLTRAEVLEQQRVIDALQARDREVRQHERAHQAAGAGLAGPASYTFQKGPDGRMYAIGGEVGIDTSPVAGDPRATLEKAQTIIRAAMAPAEPSPQDYRVAASARAMAAEARAEMQKLAEEKAAEETSGEEEGADEVSGAREAQPDSDRAFPPGSEGTGVRESSSSSRELGAVEQRLIKSGAYSQLYPPGTLFSQQA